MLKAVVFDLDNTLYEYGNSERQAMEHVAEWLSEKRMCSVQEFYRMFRQSRDQVKENTDGQGASHNRMLYFQRFSELMGWNPIEFSLELYDLYWNAFLESITPERETIALFQKLHENGVKIGICTELTAHIQHRKIRKLGIADHIDVLVTSEEAGCEKEQKFIFELLLKKLNVIPEEVLYLGDSYEKDVCGSERAGMRGVWFCRNRKLLYEVAGRCGISMDELNMRTVYSMEEFEKLVEREF